MNNATFAGRVGRDAEVRHTQSGKAVAGFSLAVDGWNGKEKVTQWIDCSLWGDRAEKLAEYITKGTPVAVSGEVSVRTYEGNNGTKASLGCNVRELTLLGKKEGGEQPRTLKDAEFKHSPAADDFGDDIPFN